MSAGHDDTVRLAVLLTDVVTRLIGGCPASARPLAAGGHLRLTRGPECEIGAGGIDVAFERFESLLGLRELIA